MRKRGVSLLLVLTLVIAAGALVQDFRFDRSISGERARALAIERDLAEVSTSLARLRAAQAAYVAAGQGPDFWMTRATDLAGEIGGAIGNLRESSTNNGALPRYAAAEAALAEFNKLDARAREFVRSDQKLFASDLVFMDSLQATERIETELEAARAAEIGESDRRAAQLSRLRLAMHAAALAGLVVLGVAMRPVANGTEARPPAATTLQMLRDLPPPVKNSQPAAPVPTPPAVIIQPGIKPANLSAAAELCVDLARVVDAHDLPALVQRTASILEAKGVVIWVADSAGALLRPSVTHGYPDRIVAKLGPLQIDGDNVTSLAFRSMQPQLVGGTSPADAGAVAVPLITHSGCVGVLAAETRPNRTGQDVLPLARIIAAQFASIVAPVDVSSDAKTAQA